MSDKNLDSSITFQRVATILRSLGISRSTFYALIKGGLWTQPVKLSERISGWPVREIEAINLARLSGQSATEIRQLVAKLQAERKNVGLGFQP